MSLRDEDGNGVRFLDTVGKRDILQAVECSVVGHNEGERPAANDFGDQMVVLTRLARLEELNH
mgnify:CR=1 FL=1